MVWGLSTAGTTSCLASAQGPGFSGLTVLLSSLRSSNHGVGVGLWYVHVCVCVCVYALVCTHM
jgi:hypothetical protein